MTEVLVYPNVTYARDLEADSFVVVLGSILSRLAILRPDLRFTVLLPEEVGSLARLPNVEIAEYPLPTYPNLMRTSFDAKRFLDVVAYRRRSWDIVWSHLPEHTVQAKNALYNSTDERPVFVGYSHWFEIPELHSMAADTLDLNLAGIAAMTYCGVNSAWLKRLVLRHAEKRVSAKRLSEFERTIWPQYLGAEPPPTVAPSAFPGPARLLVWNHRPTTYTGFSEALRALDRLWERRRDFRLEVTLGAPVTREYIVPTSVDPARRETYFAALGGGYLGLPRENCQWAVAVTDGFAAGLPYVLPRAFAYPEMVPADYPLFYDPDWQTLEEAVEWALDSPSVVSRASAAVREAAADFSWNVRVEKFSRMFSWAESLLPRIGARSKKFDELRLLAEAGATKAELKKAMGWGVGIPWTPYRTRLLDEGVSATASAYGVTG